MKVGPKHLNIIPRIVFEPCTPLGATVQRAVPLRGRWSKQSFGWTLFMVTSIFILDQVLIIIYNFGADSA